VRRDWFGKFISEPCPRGMAQYIGHDAKFAEGGENNKI
jgi:hypothetical protein